MRHQLRHSRFTDRKLTGHSAAAMFALICMMTMTSGCATSPSRAPSSSVPVDVRLHIEALNTAMEERFAAGDMAGVAAFYADDGILLSPRGTRVEGRNAIDAYWARFAEGYRTLKWDLTIDLLEGDENGRIIMQRGTSTITRTPIAGETRESIVEFVLLWMPDQNGTLRIAVDGYW